ncbi:MAG: tetratricopeptide repeat protein [Siphonobacter sp.]
MLRLLPLVWFTLWVGSIMAQPSQTDSLRKINNLAAELGKRGRYDRAWQLLHAIQAPNDTIRYNLALVELALGNYDRSLQLLQKPGPFLNAGLQKGQASVEKDKYVEALGYYRTTPATPENSNVLLYNQALALWHSAPDNPNLYPQVEYLLQQVANQTGQTKAQVALGQLMAIQGRWDESKKCFLQAHQNGSDPNILLRLGHAQLANQQLDAAIASFQEYLKKGGKEGYLAHLGLAYTHYSQGNYSLAGQSFQRVLRIRPNSVEATVWMGHTLLSQHHNQQALLQYNKALQLDSTNKQGRLGRAMAYYRLAQYKKAWRDFSATTTLLDPGDSKQVDFFICRGFCLLKTNRFQAAIAEFEIARKIQPKNPALYAGLTEAYIGMNDLVKAHQNINEALKLEPKHSDLLTNRGNLQLRIEQFDDAADDFKAALKLNNQDVNAHNGLAITDLENDRIEEALVRYDSLMTRNSRNPMLLNNRGITRSYRGLQLEQLHQTHDSKQYYARSMADFQRAMQLDTVRGFYNNNVGNVYRLINEIDKAIDSYQAYFSKTAIDNLGVLYAATNQAKLAHFYVSAAIQLDSSSAAFLYNRARLYRTKFPDSLRYHPEYAQAEQFISKSAIALKYSPDGYITIYLFDYEYNKYEYEGNPVFPIRPDAGIPKDFQSYLDFQFIPEPPKPQEKPREPQPYTYAKGKALKPKRPARKRGSTDCPI